MKRGIEKSVWRRDSHLKKSTIPKGIKRADSDVIPPIKSPNLDPCTAINPLTNGFFDLRSLSSMNLNDGSVSAWNARGYDYNMNFTLGMCSSPLKKQNIQPGDFDQVTNTSLIGGFYTDQEGVKYSIGEYSTAPVFRGRKLTLTYTNGSFCEKTSTGEAWRKSTILSFTCDRELMAKAQISFVGVLHDCDYFFEVRTVHACPTAAKSDNLALVWIFLIIFLAALMVYCGAGTLYKKAILGRRGWRQLPSYSIVRNFKAAFGSNGSLNRRFSDRSGAVNLSDVGNGNNSFGYSGNQNDLLDVLDIDSDLSEN